MFTFLLSVIRFHHSPCVHRSTTSNLVRALEHNTKYWATLCAFNFADLKTCTSNYIWVDTTKPVYSANTLVYDYYLDPTDDVDGYKDPQSMNFIWSPATDPESDIQGYSIAIGYRDHGAVDSLLPFQWMNQETSCTLALADIHLYNVPIYHTWYRVTVRVWNRAGLYVQDRSDGFMLDDGRVGESQMSEGTAGEFGAFDRGLLGESDGWINDGPFKDYDIDFQGNEIFYKDDILNVKTQEDFITFYSKWGFTQGLWNRTY